MYTKYLEISIMIIIGLVILSIVLGMMFIIWRIYVNYIIPIIKERRIDKLKKYMVYVTNLPDEEKAQVDLDDLQKKKDELDSLVPQIEPGYLDSYDIDNTFSIKKFVDDLIMAEVASEMLQAVSLNQKYEILNLDKAVSNISTRIIKGINIEVFSTRMICTPEYLIDYVTKQTTNVLIHTALDWNHSKN